MSSPDELIQKYDGRKLLSKAEKYMNRGIKYRTRGNYLLAAGYFSQSSMYYNILANEAKRLSQTVMKSQANLCAFYADCLTKIIKIDGGIQNTSQIIPFLPSNAQAELNGEIIKLTSADIEKMSIKEEISSLHNKILFLMTGINLFISKYEEKDNKPVIHESHIQIKQPSTSLDNGKTDSTPHSEDKKTDKTKSMVQAVTQNPQTAKELDSIRKKFVEYEPYKEQIRQLQQELNKEKELNTRIKREYEEKLLTQQNMIKELQIKNSDLTKSNDLYKHKFETIKPLIVNQLKDEKTK